MGFKRCINSHMGLFGYWADGMVMQGNPTRHGFSLRPGPYQTSLFFQLTTLLSRTKDITIHLVLSIYHMLFDHLEKSIRALKQKNVAWKEVMSIPFKQHRDMLHANQYRHLHSPLNQRIGALAGARELRRLHRDDYQFDWVIG